MRDVHAAVAALVATAARSSSPRRSGRLAATVRGNRAVSKATVRAGYARVPYAGPIHWGWPTRNIAAQPWISESAQATEPQWITQYERGVERALDRVKGA